MQLDFIRNGPREYRTHTHIFDKIPHILPSIAQESIPCQPTGHKGGIEAKSWANADGSTGIYSAFLGARPWLSQEAEGRAGGTRRE